MNHRASYIRLGLLALIWGSSFLFIKVALEGLAPEQIVLGRVVVGAVVLIVVANARGLRRPRALALWGHLAVVAMVGNLIPFSLFSWGETHIDSSLAGILNAGTPLFTLLMVLALLPDEHVTRTRVLGLVIGFAGVVIIVGPWEAGALSGSLGGQLACLGAAACYGVAFTYTRRFLAGRDEPLALAASQLAAAAAIALVIAPLVATDPIEVTWRVVGSVAALGAFGTGVAYVLSYRLVHDEGATTASMTTYLIPIVAVVLGVVVLGEELHWYAFAGAAVVIVGVATAEGRFVRPTALVTTERDVGTPGP